MHAVFVSATRVTLGVFLVASTTHTALCTTVKTYYQLARCFAEQSIGPPRCCEEPPDCAGASQVPQLLAGARDSTHAWHQPSCWDNGLLGENIEHLATRREVKADSTPNHRPAECCEP